MATYSQLRAFDAVAQTQSFSRAAEQISISQPGVTLQVRELERAHRITLFHRLPAGVELTDDGKELFHLTREFMEVEERIQDLFHKRSTLETGNLRIGADGPHIALGLIGRFQNLHPGVQVQITMGNWESTWQALQDQRIDAAVMANPPDEKHIDSIQLTTQDMVVLLPPGHKLESRKTIALGDLAGTPVIMREPGSNTRRVLERHLVSSGIDLNIVMELDTRESMREAVANGLGAGFLFDGEVGGDHRCVSIPIRELRGCNHDTLVCLSRFSRRASVAAIMKLATPI
jgi:LysR family transcriptional regulator, low CO2-responsive transcriptional regulator